MGEWTEHTLGEFASILSCPFGSQLLASDYVSTGRSRKASALS